MIRFPDSETVSEALQRYFDHYGFDNGGYDAKWFKIKFFGPVALSLPNIKNRVDAVKLHDIHHLLTEYEANLRGEAEIGAFELAAGCGRFYAAWVLNAASVGYGVIFWPKRIYRAFMLGRQCMSLYHSPYNDYNKKLLATTLGELRADLGIATYQANHRVSDTLMFLLVAGLILGSELAALVLFVLAIRYFLC